MRYPLLSQVTLLAIGLIVPVGVPVAMGLDYYGHFVALTASAFLVQRLADFPAETLIFEGDRHQMLLRSTALQIAFLALAAMVSAWTPYRIELPFLLSLQCSSVAFSFVLACRNDRLTLLYLITFLATYLCALLYALSTDSPLFLAIAVPNYLALLWIPWALRLPLSKAALAGTKTKLEQSPVVDVALRVAAGSFMAFATLGLASLATSGSAADTAQIRLMGTALGFSAFLLPWPMKSLVGILQAAEPPILQRLLNYLCYARWIALSLIALAIAYPTTSRPALCGGLALIFLNFLVAERWNLALGGIAGLARIALIATGAGLAAFQLAPAIPDPLVRASISILAGCSIYAALSWRTKPSQSLGRSLDAGLSWTSAAGFAALISYQR